MVVGNLPSIAATEGLVVVAMSRMQVTGTMGVPGAFVVRCPASRNFPDASPARGVSEKM
jgi:hypothetical protein